MHSLKSSRELVQGNGYLFEHKPWETDAKEKIPLSPVRLPRNMRYADEEPDFKFAMKPSSVNSSFSIQPTVANNHDNWKEWVPELKNDGEQTIELQSRYKTIMSKKYMPTFK